MKYRKKPVVIEAFQWDGSIQQLLSNVPKDYQACFYFERKDGLRMIIYSYKKGEPVKKSWCCFRAWWRNIKGT